jgi:hypothetical protein
MGNLRPFKLFCVALLKPLKYAYFIEKSTKSAEKSLSWPSTWLFTINFALEPIWIAHGWFKLCAISPHLVQSPPIDGTLSFNFQNGDAWYIKGKISSKK